MFEALKNIVNNVKLLDEKKIAVKILTESDVQEYIIKLNTLEQLFRTGTDANGKPIGYYSESTDRYTQGESFTYEGYTITKRAGNPITLYDTGEFYKSFKVLVTGSSFIIEADDQKENEYLSDIYGLEILGLKTENINELAQLIIPKVIEMVRGQILKKVS